MAEKQNVILFDWLTFTLRENYTIKQVIDMLGLTGYTWIEAEKGRNGYKSRLFFENVSILYDGADNMGICVDITGKGCRQFESYSSVSWHQLFGLLLDLFDEGLCKITRLDVAYDDHTGILDIDQIRDDTDDHLYVSRSRTWEVRYGSEGTTIYHGSRCSDMLIRIYDKAAEQCLDNEHWIRIELQMRDANASGFLASFYRSDIGTTFSGVLSNYLRYVYDPHNDTNMSRWPLAPYWAVLLDGISSLRIWSSPGTRYTVFNLSNYIINQVGNALDTYIQIFGVQDLVDQLGARSIKRSPKYDRLLEEHRLLLAKGRKNND